MAGGRRKAWLTSLTLLVVAAAFAGWASWSWFSARNDDTLHYASSRDDVRRAATREIAALNTMDYRQRDAGLRRWQDAATGALHDQLVATRKQSESQIQKAKTNAKATVTDAAVTALHQRAGTATVIASVSIRLTPASGDPTVERNRYQAGLGKTEDGWKLSSLTAIPVH